MKKIFFVGCVLTCLAFLFSCSGGKKEAVVEGTPIGQGLIIKKTDAGMLQLCTSDGISLSLDEYQTLEDYRYFIVGKTSQRISLFHQNGSSLTQCDSFALRKYYPVSENEVDTTYLETSAGGVFWAFCLDGLKPCSVTEGYKNGLWPMSNGYCITKRNGTYQLEIIGNSEPVISECKEMHLVNQKGSILLLVKTDDFSGYCTTDGQGLKKLSSAQFVSAKKTGKILWQAENGKISGIMKEKI